MNPDIETVRLLDLMPASGRMRTKIISKPEQSRVVMAPQPLPWWPDRPIYINFDLWRYLSEPQRDLLLLRSVCWVNTINLLKPTWNHLFAVAGVIGGGVEYSQGDAIGMIVGGGLAMVALSRLWRSPNTTASEIDADLAALKIAGRRGYPEAVAAEHLLGAIEQVAHVEGGRGLNLTELLRCQNLKTIAGLSNIAVPKDLRMS